MAPTARADEPAIDSSEMARQLYKDGSEAFHAGDYLEAEQRFRQVYEMFHSTSVLYDIALSLEKQGRWSTAADAYEAFIAASPNVGNRKRMEQHVAGLRELAAYPPDATATAPSLGPSVSGAASTTAPAPAPATALPGDQNQRGAAAAGAAAALVAPLAPTAPMDTVEPRRLPWWTWLIVGAGVAAAGTGVGLAIGFSPPQEKTTIPDFGPGAAGLRL